MRGFGHGELIKVTIGALVEEDLAVLLLDDDVPRVVGARGAHDGGQDAVGGEHVARTFGGILLNDRILARREVAPRFFRTSS